jgi:hypothetical protein
VLAGRTSLATLAARTASARLVISGDTGMAQLVPEVLTATQRALSGSVPAERVRVGE